MALVKVHWLDAVTSDQVTSAEEVTGTSRYCIHAVWTGGPLSGGLVALQGSVDGANWITLASVNFASPAFPASRFSWAIDMPVKYIRVELSALSGGTSPTISASVLAV